MSGACLSCKQFPGDNLSNYPSKLELLCESSWVPLAYPVQLGIIKSSFLFQGELSRATKAGMSMILDTDTENHSIVETLKSM